MLLSMLCPGLNVLDEKGDGLQSEQCMFHPGFDSTTLWLLPLFREMQETLGMPLAPLFYNISSTIFFLRFTLCDCPNLGLYTPPLRDMPTLCPDLTSPSSICHCLNL